MMSTRIYRFYLNVPFADKWKVQDLGASWDADCKQWYYANNTKNRKEIKERWGKQLSITQPTV